jgi:hypothetical protein
MKKHATKDGNQQKLQTLGEFSSANRFMSEDRNLSVQYLSFYHRRASLKCPLPMLYYYYAWMRSVATCDSYKIQNFVLVSYAFVEV